MSSKPLIASDSIFRDGFLLGAAKAYFCTAYADMTEDEESNQGLDWPQASMGSDWMDAMPDTLPANAFALAGELYAGVHVTQTGTYNPKGALYAAIAAAKADGTYDEETWVETVQDFAEEFGHCLAMESMGHGVSWFDDHEKFPLHVPHIECSQFSFDWSQYAKEHAA